MKDIAITEPVTVTLRIGEWYWILGLLSVAMNQGENAALDSLYQQVIEASA